MKKFLLTPIGLKYWLDKYKENNYGLWNTNNFTEAAFKHIMYKKKGLLLSDV